MNSHRMVRRFLAPALLLSSSLALGNTTRTFDADALISSDHTKTFTMPANTSTLLGGASSLTSNGVVLGNGTGNVVVTAAGTASQTFQVPAGGGAPVFTSHVPPLVITNWNESTNAPVADISSNLRVYTFAAGLAQAIYASVQVPTLYIVGNPIKLKMSCFSESYSSGTDLVQTVSTLTRPGTDALSSTTNQRTSTNSALTPAGSLIPYSVSLDLTDTTGKINSVSVAAGSMIQVQFQRGTDTDTSDLQCLTASEVTFQ